jgi:hypothetical protein
MRPPPRESSRVPGVVRRTLAFTEPAAIRQDALDFVEGIRQVPRHQIWGGLGYLATVSPTIRRLSLEMTDRRATAIAAVLTETTPGLYPYVAKLQAITLATVFQTITDDTGRRSHEGQGVDRIARPALIRRFIVAWFRCGRSDDRLALLSRGRSASSRSSL